MVLCDLGGRERQTQKPGLDYSDRDALPAGMSCVPPALLIHEQSGEHGVALAWVRAAQPPPPVIPLLPCSITSCLPLALPHSFSCPMPVLKPKMPCLQPAEFTSRSEADAD